MTILTAIIIPSIISTILALIFTEEIKGFLYGIIMNVGVFKKITVSGTWRCSFICHNVTYVEIIDIKQIGNRLIGRIADDPENYDAVREVMSKHPLRFNATITSDRYITGVWYHPIETDRHHGSFQLILTLAGTKAEGIWVGMSRSGHKIESDSWIFEKKA